MIKTTLTKLKKAYSTLSFAPRALGVESNGKFYKLIASLLRRADKRRKPDKTEEEECEVIAKLVLTPSTTANLCSNGLSKPEEFQKSSFLAQSVDINQRQKSTCSNQDESNKKIMQNPDCDLPEVAKVIPKPDPLSKIPEPQVSKVPQSVKETPRQETVLQDTKNIGPPNSLQSAIPDIIIDKNNFKENNCSDDKITNPKIHCGCEKHLNFQGNANLQNKIGFVKINKTLASNVNPQVQGNHLDKESPSIRFFASYDKTKKPPSTETNTSFDELAKHCLDSPNNKIDETLLKEMKKQGVPQKGPPSKEGYVIEENIIQMDVLRKPRRPTETTEIDVETRRFEYPPLNYSDEQRLEFELSSAEDEVLKVVQLNEKDSLMLASEFCNVRAPILDRDKPLLNPFDQRNIKLDDDGSYDVKDTKKDYHTKCPVVQLDKNNAPLKSSYVNLSPKPDKTLDFHKLSENKANNEKRCLHPIYSHKLSKLSEDDNMRSDNNKANFTALNKSQVINHGDLQSNAEMDEIKQSKDIADNETIRSIPLKKSNTINCQPESKLDLAGKSKDKADKETISSTPLKNSKTVNYLPECELDLAGKSEDIADKETISSTPLKNSNTVNCQPECELDLTIQSQNKADNKTKSSTPINKPNTVNCQLDLRKKNEKKSAYKTMNMNKASLNPDEVNNEVADKLNVTSKQKVYTATINSTQNPNSVKLAYSIQKENEPQKNLNQEPEKRLKFKDQIYDWDPKIPEPLLVFNSTENKSTKVSDHTDHIERPTVNEDVEHHHVTSIQDLKSLRIRCNVLPTKNTDEKATISLLVEIDAIKQPREKFTPRQRHQPDVTYREDSEIQQEKRQRSTPYFKKINRITRDKVTMIYPIKHEKPKEPQTDSLPEEKPELPLSEMLKRVRSRNQAGYHNKLEKTLQEELETEIETVTGKCGDKPKSCPPSPPRCPPPCPPPPKPRCPPSACPPACPPACPRPCKPPSPPKCPPPCPKPPSPCPIPPSPCGKSSGGSKPRCPGLKKSPSKKNPCCPGASSPSKRNPCAPVSPPKRNPCSRASSTNLNTYNCKFSMHLPTIMMNSIVFLIHQRVRNAESDLAQNHFYTVTKDAYHRFLARACFAGIYRPRLLPILNICGFDSSSVNYESMSSVLARDYNPWVPIPCWPPIKKEAKRPYPCPKGCQIPLPGKTRPPCDPNPCRGFPKRKNSFSIIDLYSCCSN